MKRGLSLYFLLTLLAGMMASWTPLASAQEGKEGHDSVMGTWVHPSAKCNGAHSLQQRSSGCSPSSAVRSTGDVRSRWNLHRNQFRSELQHSVIAWVQRK